MTENFNLQTCINNPNQFIRIHVTVYLMNNAYMETINMTIFAMPSCKSIATL